MRSNGFRIASVGGVVVLGGLLAGCATPSEDPGPGPTTSSATATPPPDGEVAQIDVCGTADAAAVERLLPGADGEPGGASGESYASATCTWVNTEADEPSGSLSLTVEVARTPDETGQRDVLDGLCGDAPVEEAGPGELACFDETDDATLTLHAIQGAALVDLSYARASGGGVSDDDRADAEQLAEGLLAVTPQP